MKIFGLLLYLYREKVLSSKLKYNCIFGGGGIRGLCHIGALKALNDLGVEIGAVAGSSVGAVFSALYAVGYSVAEIKDIFFDVNFTLFRDLNIDIFSNDISFSKGEVFYEWLKDKIGEKFYGKKYNRENSPKVTFKDLKIDLNILTLDFNTSTPFIFSKENTPDEEVAFAVRASASLPGLMKPVPYNELLLVDGDLTKSWPAFKLYTNMDTSETRLIEFRLEGSRVSSEIKNPFDYTNSIISTVWYLSTENVYNSYYQNDRYDYVVMDSKDVILFDFSIDKDVKQHLIDIGYQTTIDYFKNTLVSKKEKILSCYKNILLRINLIENAIRQKQVNNTILLVNDILASMFDDCKYIDISFYEIIKNLKENILLNSKKLMLSKMFVNPKQLIEETKFVKCSLESKIDDLVNYIKKYRNIS